MDILVKDEMNERALEHLKYELNGGHSDDEDDYMSTNEEVKPEIFDHDLSFSSQESKGDKDENLDLSNDIILPQISTASGSQSPVKPKKEIKSKKELEEEEREKMQ